MEIITALNNQQIVEKLIKNGINVSNENDIQYQEAILDILDKNNNFDILVLSSILQGEYTIYEFINLIKYKNPNLEIIIILEEENNKIENFLISKGINNIFFNNKNTIDDIIKKINEIINIKNNNKNNDINLEKTIKQKNIKKTKIFNNKKIKNKLELFKIKNKKNIHKKTKIISIIGEPKIGKTIFLLIFSLCKKNKKILIINSEKNKKNMEIIIAKKFKDFIQWKKMVYIQTIDSFKNDTNKIENWLKSNNKGEQNMGNYDYVFFEIEDMEKESCFIKKSDEIVLICQANLLGINGCHVFLEKLVHNFKIQKDNIKIIINKYNKMSINKIILRILFWDFKKIYYLPYDKSMDAFINLNTNFLSRKTKKDYKKIMKIL